MPFFQSFFTRIFPVVRADDEELVDPMNVLKEKCKQTEHVKNHLEKLEECNKRVRSKTNTTEVCTEELFDFLHALDGCVAKDLFTHLK